MIFKFSYTNKFGNWCITLVKKPLLRTAQAYGLLLMLIRHIYVML